MDDLIEIKIKVLEYQTYTVQVDKRVLICSLKEKIASVSGVIPRQQRLIFRGRALKNARLLSDYLTEDGHTLQLLARPPKPETEQVSMDDSDLSSDGSCGSYTESGVDPMVSSEMPDSLTTLSGDLNHLRRQFAAFVNNSQMSMGDEQVSGENWQRRPSHLVELLQRTRQLLTGDVAKLLSNVSELLVDHVNVTDPSARSSHQGSVLSAGTNLFLLGDSLMDLGQTTMMLHFGETPEDAFVDVGAPFIMQNRSQLPHDQLGGDSGGISSISEQTFQVANSEAQNAVNSGIEETQIVHPSQDEEEVGDSDTDSVAETVNRVNNSLKHTLILFFSQRASDIGLVAKGGNWKMLLYGSIVFILLAYNGQH